jgi:predicted nucleotide-binding protein (sugar kinase/HSP70/actin superfamily)
VGIVGEVYVRSNPFTNQELVRAIERAGGEAWLVPIAEWLRYLGYRETMVAGEARFALGERLRTWVKHAWLARDEQRFEAAADAVLGDRHEPSIEQTVESGAEWIPVDFEGEAILTIGRARKYAEQGASLVVNVAPFGCMVGALSSSVLQRVQEEMGVPVVRLFYDGDGDVNRVLEVFVANAAAACAGLRTRSAAGGTS